MIEADRTLFSVGQRDGDPFVSMYQNFPDVPLGFASAVLTASLVAQSPGRAFSCSPRVDGYFDCLNSGRLASVAT